MTREPVMFSEVVRALKAGQEIPYSEDCTHVTKDRLESSGEQMYRLNWENMGRENKNYKGGLVGEGCELVLSDLMLRVTKDSELHGTTEVYDQSAIQGESTLTDSLVKGGSVVSSAVLTRATLDNCIIDPGCLVTDASLKNVVACPHVIIDGRGADTPLNLENMVIPGYAIIDRPGQVHSLPHRAISHLTEVAVSTTGEVILGQAFMEPIRGRGRIIAYLGNMVDRGLTYGQVQENIDFVNSLTLPEKP